MMQLKEQLSFSFKADKKGSLTKLLLMIILIAGATALIAVVFWLLGFLGIVGNGIIPVSLFNIIIYLIIILSLFSCIHRLTKALYFSEDNQVLLTYPVNSGMIFLSKIVVFFIVELIKSLVLLAPVFAAYGVTNVLTNVSIGVKILYFPWLILSLIVISMTITAISAVVSIPYMFVLTFLKKFQYLQSILAFLALNAIVVLIFIGLSKMPVDLQIGSKWASDYYPAVRRFANTVETYCGPLLYIPAFVLGYYGFRYNENPHSLTIVTDSTFVLFLIFLAIIVVCLVISYFLARPLFFKMATKPFEYQKKIINHNYKMNLAKADVYEKAFRPKLRYPISRSDKSGIVNKLSKLLRKVNKEEKLFLRGKISSKRILKFLNKYHKDMQFEEVDISEITDFGYVIQRRFGVPFLVLIKGIRNNIASCYDPYYLGKKNHKKDKKLTLFVKEILLDIRTPGILLSNYLLFMITPIAISLLNALFSAINTSFQGESFTVMFNVLIIMLITLSSNVSMASIYSREGKTSYMLKAMPINYMASLTFKLIIRAFLVVASIGLTCILYSRYCKIDYVRYDLLFFAFSFIYLGHLLWSAELDFMNPKDNLYAAIGTSVNNPNEVTSAIITFLIAFLMMGISYFLVSKEVTYAFLKIMLIGLAFFLVRAWLFGSKIIGYGTSRHERINN